MSTDHIRKILATLAIGEGYNFGQACYLITVRRETAGTFRFTTDGTAESLEDAVRRLRPVRFW
jgi:hypothetical protein